MPKEQIEKKEKRKTLTKDKTLKEITRLENKIIRLDNNMKLCLDEIDWHCEHGTSDYHNQEIKEYTELYKQFENTKKICERKLKRLKE